MLTQDPLDDPDVQQTHKNVSFDCPKRQRLLFGFGRMKTHSVPFTSEEPVVSNEAAAAGTDAFSDVEAQKENDWKTEEPAQAFRDKR
jgi:hypothetical protein